MDFNVSILGVILTSVITAGLVALVQSLAKRPVQEQLARLNAQLSHFTANLAPNKIASYEKQIDYFVTLQKRSKVLSDEAAADYDRVAAIAKGLFLYGSKESIDRYVTVRCDRKNGDYAVRSYMNFLSQMRKDCGHTDDVSGIEFFEML